MRRDSIIPFDKMWVSIHAPVRMRLNFYAGGFVPFCFNSRTREDATGLPGR